MADEMTRGDWVKESQKHEPALPAYLVGMVAVELPLAGLGARGQGALGSVDLARHATVVVLAGYTPGARVSAGTTRTKRLGVARGWSGCRD